MNDSAARPQPTGSGGTLPPALVGERREIDSAAGRLSFYVAGEGRPLLLIHSINAAGSAYEVKPIFDAAVARHRCYVPDLPGFGFSDRSARGYDPLLYAAAIDSMLDLIVAETGAAQVDALALSLSSEFLARVATRRPDDFRTLAFVTPTGFSRGYRALRGKPGETREVPGLYRAFTFPLWSQGIWDLLSSRRSIRYFLKRTFGSNDFPEDLVDYDYLTTHQPGAKNAPYAFVSGRLFSKDIRDVYRSLAMPVWMPHGNRGDFGDVSEAAWVRDRPNWTKQVFATGALPHFERPAAFMAAYEGFLSAADAPAPSMSSSSPSP